MDILVELVMIMYEEMKLQPLDIDHIYIIQQTQQLDKDEYIQE
jgi:hypothetical protein